MATPNIVPRADSEGGIGTASKYWASAYIDLIYVGAGKIGRDADNLFDFSVDNEITFRVNATDEMVLNDSSLSPHANRGLSLGTSALRWKDLHLGDAAVINFNNHNVTLTHSDNALTLADGDYMQFGSSGDLQIYHSGASSAVNNTTGHLYISNGADDSDIIFQCDDGSGGVTPYLTLDGSRGFTTAQKNIRMGDSVELELGTDGDGHIIHTGSAMRIENNTGDLTILNNTNDGDIIFQSDDGSGGTTAYLTLDGSAEQTRFFKDTRHTDGIKANFGNGDDLQIYHDATDSWIKNSHGNLVFRNTKQNKDIMFQGDDGQASDDTIATYFYLDGSSATHDGSATTALYTNWPDKSYISLGTGHDLQLVHTGVNSVIQSLVGKLQITSSSDDIEFTQFGNDKDINFSSDDGSGGTATYFRLDGGEGHMIAYKELNFADGIPATFGNTAGGDLEIKEQSGSSYILNNTGNLQIQNHQDDGDIIFNCDDGSGGIETYFYLDGSANSGNLPITVFPDNSKLTFGNDYDFRIYHDSNNSNIENNVGALFITNRQDDGDIIFKSDDGSGGVATYFYLDGGGVLTRFDKKLRASDGVKIEAGSSGDLQIYHTGTGSVIQNAVGNLTIQEDQNDGDIIFRADDGSGGTTEYFRLDGGIKRTIFTENIGLEDNTRILIGSGNDLQIYHDGSNSLISQQVTGDLYIENTVNDGDIIFRSDDGSGGNATYLTLDGGATAIVADKSIYMADNKRFYAGGGGDLGIYHDGTNSYINNATGNLQIKNSTDDGDIEFVCDDGSGGNATYMVIDGSIERVNFHKHTIHNDNIEASWGSNVDLRIKHDGTDSSINNYEGNLVLANDADDGDIIFSNDNGSGGTTPYLTLDGGDVSTIVNTIKVLMPNLPTSDPGTTGQLWNDNGTLKISAGG